MSTPEDIKVTVAFIDASLSQPEKDEEVQKLLAQLKTLDEVEKVSRVLDPNPPQGSMSAVGFVVGLLKAEVSFENFKKVSKFLGNRLSQKVIELEVEANGKKLKVKASSPTELTAAMDAVEKFVALE